MSLTKMQQSDCDKTDSPDGKIGTQNVYTAISGCLSLLNRNCDHGFTVEILILSFIVSEI